MTMSKDKARQVLQDGIESAEERGESQILLVGDEVDEVLSGLYELARDGELDADMDDLFDDGVTLSVDHPVPNAD